MLIYNLLFGTASAILKAFGHKYLGGEIGFVGVLHTWGQDLKLHIHLHFIVAGGALSKDRSVFRCSAKDFLFPIIELSADFRDAFCDGINELYTKGFLFLEGESEGLKDPEKWEGMLSAMRGKRWEVYAKEPFGGAEKVLDYMGRYVHRVAISNHRLIAVNDTEVRFSFRDNRNGGELKEKSLPAEDFIGRFLQHILPCGFVRIRYFGFLHGRRREEKLKRIRELLGVSEGEIKPIEETIEELYERLTGVDPTLCPVCGKGHMIRSKTLNLDKSGKIIPMEDMIAFREAA